MRPTRGEAAALTMKHSNRPSRSEYRGWDWVVRSYQGEKFCVETAHRGRSSLDHELRVIESLGRKAYVWSVDHEGRVVP